MRRLWVDEEAENYHFLLGVDTQGYKGKFCSPSINCDEILENSKGKEMVSSKEKSGWGFLSLVALCFHLLVLLGFKKKKQEFPLWLSGLRTRQYL